MLRVIDCKRSDRFANRIARVRAPLPAPAPAPALFAFPLALSLAVAFRFPFQFAAACALAFTIRLAIATAFELEATPLTAFTLALTRAHRPLSAPCEFAEPIAPATATGTGRRPQTTADRARTGCEGRTARQDRSLCLSGSER